MSTFELNYAQGPSQLTHSISMLTATAATILPQRLIALPAAPPIMAPIWSITVTVLRLASDFCVAFTPLPSAIVPSPALFWPPALTLVGSPVLPLTHSLVPFLNMRSATPFHNSVTSVIMGAVNHMRQSAASYMNSSGVPDASFWRRLSLRFIPPATRPPE